MDNRTLTYYSCNADQVAGRYAISAGGVAQRFVHTFEKGTRVLDIGCGSGRDLNILLENGCDAEGVDPCRELLDEGMKLYPAIVDRVQVDSLPGLETVEDDSFDGVVCSAVLMHVPEEQLFDAIYSIRRVLREDGRLLLSVPIRNEELDDADHRDVHGRLFTDVPPEKHRFLFERVGFRLLNNWWDTDSLGRGDRVWATMLFSLESVDGARSLDTIESILNRDKKTATYKLALFRALSEIATTQYNLAEWRSDGNVGVPVDVIVDKWLEYYWPIVASDTFIPQINGERIDAGKPIAFRAALHELTGLYKGRGDQAAFFVDVRSNSLPQKMVPIVRQLRGKVRDTIVKGPVYYSGGGGSATFVYDNATKHIVFSADLWRELSLMGSWIIDATILRWAELTSRISHGEIQPSTVIDQLLTVPIPEREVGAARGIYEQLADKVCVWSDRPIHRSFDVDHAIPFFLWHNNDLWNLLPAVAAVNNQKRDRLPERELVTARKDCIVYYWEQLQRSYPVRFEYEASRFTGGRLENETNWENKLFSVFAEAIEVTAIQRGVERWRP